MENQNQIIVLANEASKPELLTLEGLLQLEDEYLRLSRLSLFEGRAADAIANQGASQGVRNLLTAAYGTVQESQPTLTEAVAPEPTKPKK